MGKRLSKLLNHDHPSLADSSLLDERDATAHLLSLFPDIPLDVDTYLQQRKVIQDGLWQTVQPLPGVLKLVKHLHAHKVPISVATSSGRRSFERKTNHLQELFECFEGRIVCADDPEYELKGKPSPDIFLTAARDKLNRPVGGNQIECGDAEKEERMKGLVFEDSIYGMQAGKRAGMSGSCFDPNVGIAKLIFRTPQVIWVPDPHLLDVKYSSAETVDQIMSSIEEFIPEQWGLPCY